MTVFVAPNTLDKNSGPRKLRRPGYTVCNAVELTRRAEIGTRFQL